VDLKKWVVKRQKLLFILQTVQKFEESVGDVLNTLILVHLHWFHFSYSILVILDSIFTLIKLRHSQITKLN